MASEPLRLIHIADAHLDTSFFGRSENLRRRLREACREAFKNAIDEAINRNAHAVLIAGDLFDNKRLSFATEQFLLGEVRRLGEASIDVFYATGNHDPGRANYRAHNLEWPENVHLFLSTTPKTVPVLNSTGAEIGYVTGAGHNSSQEGANLTERYKPSSGELPHVGLLHTQLMSAEGAERHQRYAPCSENDLKGKKYDYWALGHIHMRQKVSEEIPAWYAGNIQGRNPKETGHKGVLYVEVDGESAPEPEFLPLSPLIWDEVSVSTGPSISQFAPLTGQIVKKVKERIDFGDGREHLLRVHLSGESPLANELNDPENIKELQEEIRGELDVLWLDIRVSSVVPPVDIDKFRNGQTVLAEVIDLIEKLPGDDELLEEVCPEYIAGSDAEDKSKYLRRLLDGMKKQAASLLVAGEER